jgi:phosphoribosylanthranilate isomerase
MGPKEEPRKWGAGDSSARPIVKICGLTRPRDVVLARDLGAWALGFVFAPSPRRLAPAAAGELIDQVARYVASAEYTASGRRCAGMPAPLAVGVFGNASAEEVARVVEEVGLDAVQLHGDSGPGASSVRKALAGWESPMRLAGGSTNDAHGLHQVVDQGFADPDRTDGAASKGERILIIQAVPVDAEGEEEGDVECLRQRLEKAAAGADLLLFDTSKSGRFGGSGRPFPWRLAGRSAPQLPFVVAGGIRPDNVWTALHESCAWGVDVSSGVEASPGVKEARLMESLFAQIGRLQYAIPSEDSQTERMKRMKGSRR